MSEKKTEKQTEKKTPMARKLSPSGGLGIKKLQQTGGAN
jgi:hypothetical protein